MNDPIASAIAGDQDAFATVVRQHGDTVWWICLAILEDAAEAHDATQDTFIRAWRRLSSLRKPSQFRSWLYEIARNAARDRRRRRAVRDRTAEHAGMLAERADPGPSAALDQRELADQIATALEGLDAGHREVLLLQMGGQRTAAEIASIVGISDVAVRKRLSRARQRVRDGLPEEWRSTVLNARTVCLTALAAMAWPRQATATPAVLWWSPLMAAAAAGLLAPVALCRGPVELGPEPVQVGAEAPVLPDPAGVAPQPRPVAEARIASEPRRLPPSVEVMFLQAQIEGQLAAACPSGGGAWDLQHPATDLRITRTQGYDDTMYVTLDETLEDGVLEGTVVSVEGRPLRLVFSDEGGATPRCDVTLGDPVVLQAEDILEATPREDPAELLAARLEASVEEVVALHPDAHAVEITHVEVEDGTSTLEAVLDHPALSEEGRAWALQMLEARRGHVQDIIDEAWDVAEVP